MKKFTSISLVVLIVLLAVLGVYALQLKTQMNDTTTEEAVEEVEEEVVEVVEEVPEPKKAKYVFLFIGDGNGLSQISVAENYLGHMKTGEETAERFNFTTFPSSGIITTYSDDSFITDSAAAGTALATGHKTFSGTLGLDTEGNELVSIAEVAKMNDMKIGIVSTVTMTHATPAAFFANVESRRDYLDIAKAMVMSDFDYFGGGMIGYGNDSVDMIYGKAEEYGYLLVDDKESFEALKPGQKVMAATNVTLDGTIPYYIDRTEEGISLADFTRKGIELLDNDDGFFMMVESGKIDWACHGNDAVTAINEIIGFSEAIDEAIAFYNEHPDETLIVVAADHETGGMSLGFAGTHYDNFYEVLSHQTISMDVFLENVESYFVEKQSDANLEDLLVMIEKGYGLKTSGEEGDMMVLTDHDMKRLEDAFAETLKRMEDPEAYEETYLTYGRYNPVLVTVLHIVNQKAGIAWTTFSHTGIPVPVYAQGVDSELFDGYYDNTDIFYKLLDAMGLE